MTEALKKEAAAHKKTKEMLKNILSIANDGVGELKWDDKRITKSLRDGGYS